MTVTGMLPELNCDYDQLTCALQTITCQCVVAETVHGITWMLGSETIALFDQFGEIVVSYPNYPATVKVLENGWLSSNVSLSAELKFGPVTVVCLGSLGKSSTWSYPLFGLFFEICSFIIKVSK